MRPGFDVHPLLAALGLLVLGAEASAPAQQPEDRFAETVEVTEVLLDVLVTDHEERVILGLGREDFVVEEDGEPVEVTSVAFYSSRELMSSLAALQARSAPIETVPEDRYFILFFQYQRQGGELPGSLGRQAQAARQCGRWIERDLLAGDLVAVVVYDKDLELLQDFTRDRRALQEAVAAVATGDFGHRSWPSRQPEASRGPSLRSALPSTEELRRVTRDIHQGLEVLARAAKSIRGRKLLVFLGKGFGELGGFGGWRPDARFFRPMVEALNDSNIAVYPLDLTPSDVRHSFEQSLDALAYETGGYHHRFFNSFEVPLRQISDANSGYYLLSYQTRRASGESGFQRVRISVKNPQLRVRARHGYLYGD